MAGGHRSVHRVNQQALFSECPVVAQGLGGTVLNAGKCAYGLSQMLILARRLIPRYRPDYVLVQFSPWQKLHSGCSLTS